MPRSKSTAPQKAQRIAHVIDLNTWTKAYDKIRDRPEIEGQTVAWAPNPCYSCSGLYTRNADGKDPDNPAKKCPACSGTRYGPQYRAYISRADEILLGGAKGGSKSNAAIAHIFKGNPHLPQFRKDGTPILVNQSYLLDSPHYRALVLRNSAKDLAPFIAEASKYFAYFGGHFVGGADACWKFPSGAIVWVGHFDGDNAYEKYLGYPELHRIVIEELTLLPSEEAYRMLLTSMRSVHDELIPQLLATTNPIGRGLKWVKDRFVKVRKPDGSGFYEREELIEEFVQHKYTNKKIRRTRVFFPAYVRDNPYLMRDDNYMANLASLPPKKRKAMLDGDWDVLEGAYFDIWRDPVEMSLPITGEPAHACHVITKAKGYPDFKPWWPRAIGGDWGFKHKSAYYWGCMNQDTQQLVVYREMAKPGWTAEQQGIEIAKASMEDLNTISNHKIVLYFSPDAFKEGSKDVGITSHASLLAYGISQVLGPGNVFMPDFPDPDPADLENQAFRAGWHQFAMTLNQRKSYGIEIRRANNNRTLGWEYCYNMMLWDPPKYETNEFSADKFNFLFREFGFGAADVYKQAHTKQHIVYPRMQILEDCHFLRAAIPSAIHDEKNPNDVDKKHFDGMDELDAWRYLCTGIQAQAEDKPEEAIRSEYIDEIKKFNPHADVNALYMANLQYDRMQSEANRIQSVNVGGRASQRRRYLLDMSKGRIQ